MDTSYRYQRFKDVENSILHPQRMVVYFCATTGKFTDKCPHGPHLRVTSKIIDQLCDNKKLQLASYVFKRVFE